MKYLLIFTALVAAQTEPVKKEAVLEIKNEWTNEITVTVNDAKFKVPAGETKDLKMQPGEFTYQIEGITDKITRTLNAGEKFGVVVRPSPNQPPDSEPIPAPEAAKAPAPTKLETGNLIFVSYVSYSTTVVVNDKEYIVPGGQKLSVEVPVGSVLSYIKGTKDVVTTNCVLGGNYIVNIRDDTGLPPTGHPTSFSPGIPYHNGWSNPYWR